MPTLRAPNRRGRPSAAQVAAIEDDILAAAHALFLELGYEAASMEGVAERAGISKGTLYARHAGKEALFRAVIRYGRPRRARRTTSCPASLGRA